MKLSPHKSLHAQFPVAQQQPDRPSLCRVWNGDVGVDRLDEEHGVARAGDRAEKGGDEWSWGELDVAVHIVAGSSVVDVERSGCCWIEVTLKVAFGHFLLIYFNVFYLSFSRGGERLKEEEREKSGRLSTPRGKLVDGGDDGEDDPMRSDETR